MDKVGDVFTFLYIWTHISLLVCFRWYKNRDWIRWETK